MEGFNSCEREGIKQQTFPRTKTRILAAGQQAELRCLSRGQMEALTAGRQGQQWCCLCSRKAAENSLFGNTALNTISGFWKDELFPPVRKQLSIKSENVFIQKHHCKMKAQVNLQKQPASMARVFL